MCDIMRPGTRLRMTLEAERRAIGQREALQRAIEQRDMRYARVGRQRIGIDGEAVVLRSDQHAAGIEILHRMIGAVMAEWHLARLRAQREPHQLVAEADAE